MLRFLALAIFLCGALRAETVLALPFFNHSASANLEWIGESIAETVHDALASQGLLALDREDRLEAYRRLSLRPGAELTHASIIKIGEALDASRVVYGYYEMLPAQSREPVQRVAADHRANSRPEARLHRAPLSAKWARWKTWRRSRCGSAGRR